MVDVFISYARKQRDLVEPLKEKLEEMGLDVFFDLEGIDGGSVFPDVITRALDSSKAVLTCWSPIYFTRSWCLIEAREGKAREILLPVVIEPFERTAPPADLRHVNWFNISDWKGEDKHEDWNRTLVTLGKLVGRQLAPKLKRGVFGGVKIEEPAPEPSPAIEASVDLISDLETTWKDFPAREDLRAVSLFLEEIHNTAPNSYVCAAVERHIHMLMKKSKMAEAFAHRQREELESRFGPEVARAKTVAIKGGPVAERLFPLRLQGVPNWPEPHMVAIPPGWFLMGSPKGEQHRRVTEGPQHEVAIDYPFALGQHTVTFAEWDAALAAGANLEMPGDEGWGRDRRPVININWEDAQDYLAWLNERLGLLNRADAYRLPSEAEWEYACRAGTTTPYSFGKTISKSQAQFREGKVGSAGQTVPVGSFAPNAFGLYDMHGNVLEWCADQWQANYMGAPTDGSVRLSGDGSVRILRGGSWLIYPQDLRSANRARLTSASRDGTIGFRIARTL